MPTLYDALFHMRPGSARRRALLQCLRQETPADIASMIPVNCKWQLNTQDPDLRKLLKAGQLSRVRSQGRRGKHSFKRQTYLVLAG